MLSPDPPNTELTPCTTPLGCLEGVQRFGAGFKIAALDMELRGAGNLLGGQQSGHIDSWDSNSIRRCWKDHQRMRGEERAEEVETQLNLGVDIRIPADYIHEENQRLRMYKRIAGVTTRSSSTMLRGNWRIAMVRRRRGAKLGRIRGLTAAGRRLGVVVIDRKRDFIAIKFAANAKNRCAQTGAVREP